jgi:hypothetical protein
VQGFEFFAITEPAFSPDDYVQSPPQHENAAQFYCILRSITCQGAAGVNSLTRFLKAYLAHYQRNPSDARGQGRMPLTAQPAS